MALRLLERTAALYRRQLDEDPDRDFFSPVLIIVICNSLKGRWTAALNISELLWPLLDPEMSTSRPYNLIMLQELSNKKLRRMKGIVAAVFFLERNRKKGMKNREKCGKIVQKAMRILSSKKPHLLRKLSAIISFVLFDIVISPEELKALASRKEVMDMFQVKNKELAEVQAKITEKFGQKRFTKGLDQGREQGHVE